MHQHHGHSHTTDAGSGLGIAFLLNLTFTLLEIAGGIWTNSIAILTDALHDSGDCLSLGLAWYFQRLSSRPADARHTYGYRRFSVLGALISGIVLLAGLTFVAYHAVVRLSDPQPVHVPGMLALATVGIAFNGAAAWKLRAGASLNEKLASWHLLEDTLGWAAVLVGSAVMLVWNLPIIDPLLSLLISIFVLWNVIRNLRQVLAVLLQKAPPGFDLPAIENHITRIPHVLSTHHSHLWSLDGTHHVFSTHLVLDEHATPQDILDAKNSARALLADQNLEHVTIETEHGHQDCLPPEPKKDQAPNTPT